MDTEIEKFKTDCAKFSANYLEFIIIVKTPSKRVFWKNTDATWALGACNRYLISRDELDRHDERLQISEDEENSNEK